MMESSEVCNIASSLNVMDLIANTSEKRLSRKREGVGKKDSRIRRQGKGIS